MASHYNDYPEDLEKGQLDHIVNSIKDWTIAHGLAIRPPSDFTPDSQDPQDIAAIPAPVTLFPSLFPSTCFEEAVAIQKAYNELYARIAMDEGWLGEIIQE